jgi:DNA polymerase
MNERKRTALAEMGIDTYRLRTAAAPAAAADDAAAAQPQIADRREWIMSLGWDALQHAVRDCTACKLCKSRTQTVFGVGDPKPQWVVIGEAPGASEDEQGEPFVGQSGKLLDNMLASIGLARGKGVYILNTLKCRPPDNRNPEPDEMAQCEPFLKRQLELLQPKIIVCVGKFAITSLLNTKESVGALRGRVHRYAGIPTIVTYHPAYLLRNLAEKRSAWEDLCFARRVAAGELT